MSTTPREIDSTIDWTELNARLAEPFPAHLVSWRAGATSRDKKRAQALPYAEPRAYEDRLNELAPGNWECHFRPWGESRLICELTIHGVTRSSTGEFEERDKSAIAQGTAAEAQAFKRACSKFGLGRYLYDIPLVWVDYDEERRRLVETPDLDGRFLPGRTSGGEAPARAAREPQASEAGTEGRLSLERAEAMRRELEKLGVRRRDQYKFAGAVLGRRVAAFTDLTDAEATEIWHIARRSHREVA